MDVLLVPGGNGVNALMEDEEVLNFLRHQAAASKVILSVCTGALLCGAAGLLEGKRRLLIGRLKISSRFSGRCLLMPAWSRMVPWSARQGSLWD